MKKKRPAIHNGVLVSLLVLAALIVSGLIFISSQKDKPESSVSTEPTQEQLLQQQLDKACQIFSSDKAQELLGPNATEYENTNEPTSSYSDDIVTSRCTYTDQEYNDSSKAEIQKLASLTLRSPRTDAGKTANQAVFADGAMPVGAEKVDGYGDAAFWNNEYGQLNILKAGQWYILEYGSLLPESRSLGDTQKFADILEDKL